MNEICGKFNAVVSSWWDKLLGLFGIVTVVSIGSALLSAKEIPSILVAVKTFLAGLGLSISAVTIAAIATALIVMYIVWRLFLDDCVSAQSGQVRCLSGLVEAINGENWGWVIAPDHPSVDLVVRAKYEPVLVVGQASAVQCSPAGGMILRVFFKSSRICAIRLAGAIGGTVGAAVGAVVASIAGAALAAAVGCTAALVFSWACLLVLLVVVLIVIAAAAIAALIAGGVTAAATSPSAAANAPAVSPGDAIAIGDELSAQGPVAINNNYDGQAVQYFNLCCARLGTASRPPSYTNADADTFIGDTADSCPLSCP